MADGKQAGAGRGLGTAALSDLSQVRAVAWLEAAVAGMSLLSLGVSGWNPGQLSLFNAAFAAVIMFALVVGLVLFRVGRLRFERGVLALVAVMLAGILLVSYAALMYETGGLTDWPVLILAVPGAAMAMLSLGLMMVSVRQSSRLAGYHSLWLFGLLLALFMPLHELGSWDYSGRDLLVGFFGLGVSLLGAMSFAMERHMASRTEGWLTAGDAKYITGKYDEALEYYEQALSIEPKSPKAWANSGSALLKLGLWARALESFERAIALDPALALAHSGKGLALTYLKRYTEALESHDRAISIGGGAVGWNNRGNTVMRMGGDPRDAIESYERAVQADPGYEIAWFNKGKAELAAGQDPEAVASFTKAAQLKPQFAEAWLQKGKALSRSGGKAQEALYCIDTALELNPTNSEAWAERKILLTAMKSPRAKPIPLVGIPRGGAVFGPAARNRPLLEDGTAQAPSPNGARQSEMAVRKASEGDYPGALATLEARLATAGDDVPALMTKGILLSRVERFGEALEAFERAISLKPGWVGPLFGKGMVQASMGEYDAAYVTMDTVTGMRPGYADAWSVKGIILGIRRRYAEAIDCFDRVLELDPANVDALRSKFTALNKLGRYEDALRCYEKLVPLTTDMEEASRLVREEQARLEDARTLFRQGVDLAKSKLYDEGLALLGQAIELRPNYVDALYISGVVSGVKGDYPAAMERFERVLELRPDHVEALYGKANILLKQGSPAKALDILERVLELDGTHVDAWCDRGIALARLGKQSDALECYDRALSIAGDHPQAIAQRERCVEAMREATETDTPPS